MEEKNQVKEVPKVDSGLFSSLLNGDVRHIYDDIIRNKSKYNEEEEGLVTKVLSSGVVSPEDLEKLNKLTLKFFEKTEAASVKRQPPKTTISTKHQESYEPLELPSSIFPDDVPKPFWWL